MRWRQAAAERSVHDRPAAPRSEILPLTWRQVDFGAGTVRLEPSTTKNDEARVLPFAVLPELADTLREEWNKTMAIQIETGSIIPWVFHRRGKPIKDFYGAWKVACEKAGVPQRIPHDFRRTAVRNLERARVPRSVAMKIAGHKTEAVYRRYAIVSEADLSEGLKKLAKLHSTERLQRQNPVLATEKPQPQDEITNENRHQIAQPIVIGAGDRDRTGTGLLSPRDFKSLASAYSATPARVADFNIARMAHSHFSHVAQKADTLHKSRAKIFQKSLPPLG